MADRRILLTVSELCIATQGYCFCNNDFDADNKQGFSSVAIDSRNVCEGSLFVPLVGTVQDGHAYIEQAVRNGADIILVQKSSLKTYESVYKSLITEYVSKKLTVIIVDNTLHALQKAAAYYVRKFPNLKRIAVTGSSGKTTAKECITSVLSGHYNVIMNEGNLNSETGLPLSVFKITEKHEIGIFEMGMNRHGEIKELADVFFPEVAVITNIGTAHIGIFGTQDKIAEEKKQIFSNFVNNSVGFIFEDEPYYDFLVKNHNAKFYTYGEKTTGGISSVKNKGIHGSDIEYDSVTIAFPLAGEYNVQHACAAIAVGQYFSLCAEEIKHGLESVKPLFGRTQLLEGKPTIIQDCYNGNYESMTAALGFFSSIEWQAKKILVLGDMLELGEKSKEIHKKIAEHAILSPVHIIFFIGENFFDVMQKKDIDSHKKVFYTKNIDDESLKALIFSAGDIINPQDLVLIKGSRGISLERTVQMLRNAVKIYSEGKQ